MKNLCCNFVGKITVRKVVNFNPGFKINSWVERFIEGQKKFAPWKPLKLISELLSSPQAFPIKLFGESVAFRTQYLKVVGPSFQL